MKRNARQEAHRAMEECLTGANVSEDQPEPVGIMAMVVDANGIGHYCIGYDPEEEGAKEAMQRALHRAVGLIGTGQVADLEDRS